VSTPCIHSALCGGGRLHFKQPIPNRLIVSAHISFSDGTVIKGEPSLSVLGAIENLETKVKAEMEANP
jgi:hypothetical protein